MKLVKIVALLLFMLLLSGVNADSFAGGVVGNGGDLTEIEVINTGGKLSELIASPKGRKLFPEVDPVKFQKTVEDTLVKVVDEDVRDDTGALRSAINYKLVAGDKTLTVIKFDRRSFTDTWKDQSAEQVVLVCHEYMNLMGLELTSRDANMSMKPSSTYPICGRILPHIEELTGVNLESLKTGNFLRLSCTNIRRPVGTGFFMYPNGSLDLQGRFYIVKAIRRKHYRTSTKYKGQYEAIQFKNGNEMNIFWKKPKKDGESAVYYAMKVLFSGDNEIALGYLEFGDFDFRALDARTRFRKIDQSLPMRCVLIQKDEVT